MPYINCRVMEGVLSEDQKVELAEQITETFASVVGEPVRGLTWVGDRRHDQRIPEDRRSADHHRRL
jgi:hypothetical protein